MIVFVVLWQWFYCWFDGGSIFNIMQAFYRHILLLVPGVSGSRYLFNPSFAAFQE